MSLLAMLARSADRVPERPAFVFRDRSLTYGALLAGACAVGNHLTALGVRPGQRVALQMPNAPEFGLAYFGILAAGATVVPLNPLLKAEEVRYVLQDSEVAAMLCLPAGYAGLRAARQGLGRGLPIGLLGGEAEGRDAGDVALAPAGGLVPAGGVAPLDGNAVAVCLYTSGTTGRPKGAMLTHGNLLSNLLAFNRVLQATETDVFLTVLPLFHAFAATVMFLGPILLGATIVLEPRFAPDLVLKAVAERRVTLFSGVPTMYAMLAATPRPSWDLSSWRLCVSGGAALPPLVLEAFEGRYGVPIYEGYGPTECSPVLTVNPPGGIRKIGSVGPAIPEVELRIVDDEDRPQPTGTVGEIVARGPNVMLGYLNRPAETAQALRHGWYHTGDLGRVDEDGYYSIVDRKTDLIIVGGLNVYPREIELVLTQHPAVAESAVIGVPDALRGEVPQALVVLREGVQARSQSLLAWCRQRLAAYKVPRGLRIVPALPKTVTGKVLKSQLRAGSRAGAEDRVGP
jgi:long-chain acyl-CoA synthetase